MIVNEKSLEDNGQNGKYSKYAIINHHGTPKLPNTFLKAFYKKVIGFPEYIEYRETDYFAKQNANDSEEGR